MSTSTLEYVDPAMLVIGANVRLDPNLDRQFIASVRERGVLQPIVAHRRDDQLAVVYGQRRTLAAVQTGRDLVPVMIVDTPQEADRLVDQLAENDHRAAVTNAERVAAYEQLSMLGLSANQIAKRTARGRAEVDAALTVARSKLAASATRRWDFLTIDQAAVLAEFEDDSDAVKLLVVAAKEGGFAHRAQQLRDQRDEQAAKTKTMQALAESGLTVIDQPRRDDSQMLRLTRLLHDGNPITPDSHRQCPGHAAFVANEWIQADDDDDDEDSAPERGWIPVYVCTDFARHGHVDAHSTGHQTMKAAQTSDAERDAARTERRDVIQSNKDWISAETVRLEWLTAFLTRKTAPKGTVQFVATSLASAHYAVFDAIKDGNRLAMELLGIWPRDTAKARYAHDACQELGAYLAKANDARAQVITLAILLAAYEAKTGKHSWRAVEEPTARYLLFLEANGYELSTVERRACGRTVDAAQNDGTE